jgi:hypothetical protein
MDKGTEKIITIVIGCIAEGIFIKTLIDLNPASLAERIFGVGILMAGIIGIAYLVIKIVRPPPKD